MLENGIMEKLPCGCKMWTLNGWYHRLDGSAIEAGVNCPGGHLYEPGSYYIHGHELSKWEHTKKVEAIKAEALKKITDMLIECFAWSYVHKSHSAEKTKPRLDSIWRDYHNLGGRLSPPIWQSIADLFEQQSKGK